MRLLITGNNEVLIDLTYQDGQTHNNFVAKGLSDTVNRWLQDGLHEWVHIDGSPSPRTTECTDPEFLSRLKAYLEKQFPSFTCSLMNN